MDGQLTFSALPRDIFGVILDFLVCMDWVSVMRTCKKLNEIISPILLVKRCHAAFRFSTVQFIPFDVQGAEEDPVGARDYREIGVFPATKLHPDFERRPQIRLDHHVPDFPGSIGRGNAVEGLQRAKPGSLRFSYFSEHSLTILGGRLAEK